MVGKMMYQKYHYLPINIIIKIRDLFKVRSELKKKERERERERDSETLNIY